MEVGTGNSQETTVVATEAQAAPNAEQVQLQEFERMAFGGPRPAEQQTALATEEGAASTTTTEVATTTVAPATVDYLKELGYDSLEVAKAEIEALRQLKSNPPATAFKFENEESERLAKAINANPKEAFKILEKQERIEALVSLEVNKENAADIIKFGMQLDNPNLTPQEIEFQYKQDYIAPKEPVQKSTEDEDEFTERHNEWKERVEAIEMKRTIAAKMAQPKLAAAKQKIVLPDTSAAQVDKDYELYKASLQSDLEFEQKVIVPSINALTEDKIKIAIDVNDANNKMQFGVSITPDKADLDDAKQTAMNFDKFIASINYDKDNKFTADNLASAILKLKHFDKYMQSAARQAVNAERARVLAEETKGGGSQRDFNTTYVEPTELQKLEKMAFG